MEPSISQALLEQLILPLLQLRSDEASIPNVRRIISHVAQCKIHGGLPAATRRALKQIAAGENADVASPPSLRPGAHLVREWNGRTYQVHVVDGGFELDGKTWRSLSAIAKHIRGPHGQVRASLVLTQNRESDGDDKASLRNLHPQVL